MPADFDACCADLNSRLDDAHEQTILDQWRKFLEGLAALRRDKGFAVVLIAHAKIEKFENPETESYDRYVPRLHKLASALIQEWCDEVLGTL
jgi:hypothetical protein